MPFNRLSLRGMLFLLSNLCTALIVYLFFYFCHYQYYISNTLGQCIVFLGGRGEDAPSVIAPIISRPNIQFV